jgi:hypothetical protein
MLGQRINRGNDMAYGKNNFATAALLTLGSLSLVACGGGGMGAGAFEAACNEQGDFTPEICACLETEAQEGLSPDGYAFMTAAISGDEEAAAQLRRNLDFAEATEAGLLLVSGVQRCAFNNADLG